MEAEKYTTYPLTINAILGLIEANDIAIPEIQRPFVWKNVQVRDLLDSLYHGYPTGYLIVWKNPNVKLKDGTISAGKKVLIDGQQRTTALMTAIAGKTIINADYKQGRVKIAFDPFAALHYMNGTSTEEEIFAVQTAAHLKDKKWIPDVAEIFKHTFSNFKFVYEYCANNPGITPEELDAVLNSLKAIGNRSVGIIELADNLNIDIITDIFIRINSKGTALSQGDFVMSKIAADEIHGGNTLRKLIDYYSHLSLEPTFYDYIASHDTAFAATPYLQKLEWLKHDNELVYDPKCDDVIRVAFMHKFGRAKMADLVSLLSGRDFETREYRDDIIDKTYETFREGVLNTVNEQNFKQFMIAIKSAGFISPKLVNSNMALDFAFTIYLMLHYGNEVSVSEVKRIVQRWYVLSVLTGRYSSSPESAFARDIKRIGEQGVVATLKDIEAATLSENFWEVKIVQDLTMTSTNNPTYLAYLAAQVYFNDISLLSSNIAVRELIELGGDVHHIFPKEYLKSKGFEKGMYNQEGNYAYLDRPVNESIGKKAPCEYFNIARNQCETKEIKCGSITDYDELMKNLATNCIPEDVFEMDESSYDRFLGERRKLMAQKIRKFYENL